MCELSGSEGALGSSQGANVCCAYFGEGDNGGQNPEPRLSSEL